MISLAEEADRLGVAIQTLWPLVSGITSTAEIQLLRKLQQPIRDGLEGFEDKDVLATIERQRNAFTVTDDRHPKEPEVDVLDSGKPSFGRDVPESVLFGETLDRVIWERTTDALCRDISQKIARVVLLHRLREVVALTGFTRFEPITTDENGGLDIGTQAAALDVATTWLPAVENRGEGVFVSFKPDEIADWSRRVEVVQRARVLQHGFANWRQAHPVAGRDQYPSLAYVLLHSIAHILMQQITVDCGYPLTSLKERIYAVGGRYGILLYTSSSDAEGTLGGLVNSGRRIVEHLAMAIRSAQLCSNDPVCAEHDPATDEGRELSGAACHGCLFLPETSCEIRNDFLDRALVVQTIQDARAAFFGAI